MSGRARPPRLARAILSRALPPDAHEFVTGDLDEEFASRRLSSSPSRAAFWYWSQALRSAWHTRRQESVMPRSRVSLQQILASIVGDARIAVRALRRARGYTTAAVLTLALGVGASIAIFSAVNEVMLRPLPFAAPDRLAMLWESNAERDWHQVHAAPANVADWRERARSFTDIAMLNDSTSAVSLGGGSEPAQVIVAQVSGNLFDVLGARPFLGRTFREDETFEAGRVVLSHRLWQRQFAADPAIVGRTIRLDGRSHEVIGVMGPAFRYEIANPDLWTTMPNLAARQGTVWFRRAHVVRAVGRLKPDVSFAQARAELTAISLDLEREYPDTNVGMRGGLTPLKTYLVGDERRTTLLLLLGAVGLLQLIACFNVANLTMGRGVARRSEVAVRAALGAGRRRLVRQMLTESLVLAGVGTALGVGLGYAGLQAITAVSPPELEGLVFRADWRLLTFVVALAAGSAVLFGTWPAWRASTVDAAGSLRDGTRTGSAGRSRLLAANGLVAFEIAIAVLLVVAAGLMVRSLDELRRVPLGVDTANVLTFQLHPASGTYPDDDARVAFAERLVERMATIPGVVTAGISRGLPLTGYAWSSDFTIDRWAPDQFGIDVRHREATPGYFAALKIPVIDGRLFDDSDLAPGRNVPVVVNRAFAERYFPTESPVGRRIVFDRQPTERSHWYPIVGVVDNERKALTMAAQPEIIAHLRGDPPATFTFVLRTAVPPLSVVSTVRSAIGEMDREAPLLAVRTMDEVVYASRATERFVMLLLGAFAVSALLLAAVGVYGVANQAARARTREVGIRLALGAPGASIVRRFVARGTAFVGVGLAVGMAGALAGSRLLESFLFNVNPRDPLTLVVVTVVIAGVALAANVWPTWRATHVDPVTVLRSE